MKVYYNGFNLHHQFPSSQNIVENFIDHIYDNLGEIEVSYQYVVLLVADVIVKKGAKNETIDLEEKISQICCNEDKIVVLLKNGKLLKITEGVASHVPKVPEMDETDRFLRISLGSKLMVALTEKGALYNFPNKLEFNRNDVIDVQTGREHCLLLAKNGDVFSFGRGSRGQLGHGSLDDEPEPKLIEALAGIKIKTVAVGGWHSCALSEDKDLYIWGWNGSGQLGGGESPAVVATPQVLDVEFNIRLVGCGGKHTVVLGEDGKLWGCGWNKYKQLKDDPKENLYKVTFLRDFSAEKVKGVKCGPWNTLVLCEG